MEKLTRRQFLQVAAAGVAGTIASGLMTGCSILGQKDETVFRPTKILVLNDMHITDSSSLAYPRRVIEAMNKEDGDLVLACGDFAKDGLRSELENAKSVVDELKMPYYPVLGNHDALYSGEKEETLFMEIFGLKQTNYHFLKNGIHFIGIDHGCGKGYKNNAVRPNVIAWITKTLKEIPANEPIVLFSHYPFARKLWARTKNSAEVKSLFENKKLLAIAGGHYHANTELWENGVLITTTACSSGRRENHDGTKAKGFRVFHIDANMNVTTEFKEVK